MHTRAITAAAILALAPPLAAPAAAQVAGQLLQFASPRHEDGGKFGWAVAGVPDLNGDGRGDYLVSAEAEPANINPDAGRLYIYSGASGQRIRMILPPTRQPIGTFGWSVAGTPDITGDGRGDFLVGGIWETDNQGRICGRAYLYNGATGSVVRAWVSPRHQESGGFGWSVAWVPDVNGDGRRDIVVGAPFEDVGHLAGAGRVYIYSGATGKLHKILLSGNRQILGNFGYSVAGISDVNGDGRGDVIIGAPSEGPGTSIAGAGRVYIYSGATGRVIRAFRSATESLDGKFGYSVAAVGDSNGDGKEDVLIGAPFEASAIGHNAGGRVHLFSGANGAGIRRLSSLRPWTQGNFGFAVAPLVNPDGSPTSRFVIGAPDEYGTGRAYVYGPPGSPIYHLTTRRPLIGGKFGAAVAGIPDTNGDGQPEVGVGAHTEPIGGRAYLFR